MRRLAPMDWLELLLIVGALVLAVIAWDVAPRLRRPPERYEPPTDTL